jgi:hypothetical protein
MVWVRCRRWRRRRFSRSTRASCRSTSRSCAGRACPWRSGRSRPAARCWRHLVRCEEYSPSRRSRAPSSPGPHRSACSSTRSLYAAVNRRRPAGRTSGSGSVCPPCGWPDTPSCPDPAGTPVPHSRSSPAPPTCSLSLSPPWAFPEAVSERVSPYYGRQGPWFAATRERGTPSGPRVAAYRFLGPKASGGASPLRQRGGVWCVGTEGDGAWLPNTARGYANQTRCGSAAQPCAHLPPRWGLPGWGRRDRLAVCTVRGSRGQARRRRSRHPAPGREGRSDGAGPRWLRRG